jgi:hypothetical protein
MRKQGEGKFFVLFLTFVNLKLFKIEELRSVRVAQEIRAPADQA